MISQLTRRGSSVVPVSGGKTNNVSLIMSVSRNCPIKRYYSISKDLQLCDMGDEIPSFPPNHPIWNKSQFFFLPKQRTFPLFTIFFVLVPVNLWCFCFDSTEEWLVKLKTHRTDWPPNSTPVAGCPQIISRESVHGQKISRS